MNICDATPGSRNMHEKRITREHSHHFLLLQFLAHLDIIAACQIHYTMWRTTTTTTQVMNGIFAYLLVRRVFCLILGVSWITNNRIALRGSPDGSRCCQMVPDAVRCCRRFPDAARCCQPRCCQVLPNATRRCQMFPDAAR